MLRFIFSSFQRDGCLTPFTPNPGKSIGPANCRIPGGFLSGSTEKVQRKMGRIFYFEEIHPVFCRGMTGLPFWSFRSLRKFAGNFGGLKKW
jgi:hypothetical protein